MRIPSQPGPAPAAAVVSIRPDGATPTVGGLPALVGVSDRTAGATGICMHVVELPPGAAAVPHAHIGFETAIHVLQGSLELWYGTDLEQRTVSRAGDFLFIPPGVPHQPRNRSMTTTVRAVIARNSPAEQERVVPTGRGAA